MRPETEHDGPAIYAVNAAAFPTEDEAKLVDRLRRDGDLVLSLVAERDGAIVGHVAFSRIRVENESSPSMATALAPVAVLPDFQRRGVGTAMIVRGLELLAAQGETMVFVLGDPAYYRRFGFRLAPAAFRSEYQGPHFQLRRLADNSVDGGRLHHAPAFAGLA